MSLESHQRPQEEPVGILTSWLKWVRPRLSVLNTQSVEREIVSEKIYACFQRICIFMCSPSVCMQMNEPVFLKGKSSLFSIGDGRAYWQVGDVPPCGGEPWSSDVWWEDLMKAVRRNRLFSYRWFESWYLCRVLWREEKKHTYVYQSFWWWTTEWLTPLPVGSLADLLNRNSWSFCFTSLLATAPVRPKGGKQKGLRLP